LPQKRQARKPCAVIVALGFRMLSNYMHIFTGLPARLKTSFGTDISTPAARQPAVLPKFGVKFSIRIQQDISGIMFVKLHLTNIVRINHRMHGVFTLKNLAARPSVICTGHHGTLLRCLKTTGARL